MLVLYFTDSVIPKEDLSGLVPAKSYWLHCPKILTIQKSKFCYLVSAKGSGTVLVRLYKDITKKLGHMKMSYSTCSLYDFSIDTLVWKVSQIRPRLKAC